MTTINSIWKEYHKNKRNIKANENLIKCIELFNCEGGQEIDLGCGSGADSLAFLFVNLRILKVFGIT